MAAPQFSVGVNADPILVEQTIDKTLDQIIKERRDKQGAGAGRGSKTAAGGGKKDAAKRKAGQVAKSVGTGKAKREAALAKKRGISKTSKPESLQIDAQVQRNKGKQAKKKVVKDAEALVASTKGASKAKARKKRSKAVAGGGVTNKAMTAAQEKRGGPRPGGKKQGAGPGGPTQAPPDLSGKGFNMGVRGGKRQQQQQQQQQLQAPVGRRTRRRRGGGGVGGAGGSVGVGDVRAMAAAQPITAKGTRKPRRKKQAGDTGDASSTTFTFTPDRNLQISFLSGSGGGSGRGGGKYPGGSYVHGSPDGVGRHSTDASKSFRFQPRSAVGAISSASAFSPSSPPFDNDFRNGGGGRVGGGAGRYTPPARTGSGNGSRRVGPKDAVRAKTHAMDRMMTSTKNSRALTMAARRNRQGESYKGGAGSGGRGARGARGGNEEAPRRVIILGNRH